MNVKSYIYALLMFWGVSTGLQAQEINQTHNGQTLNANLVMADGKGYADDLVLLLHGTLTHKGRSRREFLVD